MNAVYISERNSNVAATREMIAVKQGAVPFTKFFSTDKLALCVKTDRNHFPYRNWFRGVYNSPCPIVAEREAGFACVLPPACLNPPCCDPCDEPSLIFQVPSSTTLPCLSGCCDSRISR